MKSSHPLGSGMAPTGRRPAIGAAIATTGSVRARGRRPVGEEDQATVAASGTDSALIESAVATSASAATLDCASPSADVSPERTTTSRPPSPSTGLSASRGGGGVPTRAAKSHEFPIRTSPISGKKGSSERRIAVQHKSAIVSATWSLGVDDPSPSGNSSRKIQPSRHFREFDIERANRRKKTPATHKVSASIIIEIVRERHDEPEEGRGRERDPGCCAS